VRSTDFQSQWVKASKMRQSLGISRTHQWRLMKQNYFKAGVHFFRTKPSNRSELRFNLPACEMALLLYTQS